MSIYELNGYLNNYGFCIKKNKIPLQINTILDKYFSVKPELNYENEKIKDEDKYFKVYYQDTNYIVLPKFSPNIKISIEKYIKPNEEGKQILKIGDIEYSKIVFVISKYKYKNEFSKFNFKGKLRDYQQTIINEIFKQFCIEPSNPTNHSISQTIPKGGLIKLSCGGGKCLGYNTPVMMADGTIKMVQDIIIGDKLMGDDSKPREVLSLARGREQMYRIIQENSDSYIVNSSHILSLYKPKTNEIIDISVQDFLKIKNTKIYTSNDSVIRNNGLYGFKVNVRFGLKPIPFDAYYFGDYLMSGIDIKDYYSKEELDEISNLNIQEYCKKIPMEYKANHYTIQLQVLAGIIDSVGIVQEDSYTIQLPNTQLYSDIIFILNSLGLKHVLNQEQKQITIYDKLASLIPTKIKRIYSDIQIKKLFNSKNPTDYLKNQNINYYEINIEQLEEDEYYGFEIDGNRRFLLGDFTVTHNTMLAIYLAWALGLKTLVVTHKEFLMDQWEERIRQFTTAKVGRIRQSVVDVKDKDIVIGMLRSLSIKDYPTDILQQFGLVIYDEVHHAGSRVDSHALLKTSAQYTLGLSATPDRADGMTKVINWHIGNILYEMEKKYNYRVLVKKIYFRSNDPLFREKKIWFQGRMAPSHTSMTENITKIKTRNQLIVNMIDILKGMGRKILVLSYRVEHLELLKKMVDDKIKLDGETHIYNSYFYMGKTKRGEKRLAEKDGHIIFATMQLAEEGLDISHLDTVIFALPVSIQKDKKNKKKIKSSKALIQSIGRILRNDKLEDLRQIPLVVDLSDMFSIYSSWSNKRNEIYGKKNWYLQNYYWEDLEFLNSSSILTKEGDKKIKPMNIIFDDITDENFIEKNLMVSDEEAKKMNIVDKQDELNEQNECSEISTSETKSIKSIKSIKSTKSNKETKQNEQIEEISEEIKPVKYGFGKNSI